MAGFFSSLGNNSSRETNSLLDNLNNPPWNATSSSSGNNNGMFLYRNEEIYQKGLEIWQQQSCFQFHHQQNHSSPAAAGMLGPTGSGMSSLTSTRCMMRSAGTHGGLSSGGGGVNCQDCGNQAKKDCAHSRCRTCCKSRGFDCPTHVRSTWVPAAKRRERQQQRLASTTTTSTSDGSHQLQIGVKSGEDDLPQTTTQKRQRNNYLTSTGFELGKNLPSELSSTAVFRCVRVHSTDIADEQQIAYQTAVNVGGRLFKGILYDQGPEGRYPTAPPGGGKQLSACNLKIGAATATQPENSLLESNAMYSPPISAFLAGTQFFPTTPRS